MNSSFIRFILGTAALLLCASVSFAAETKAAAPAEAEKAGTAQKKSPAKIKPVDINSAGKAALMKLQGIGEAEAARIVAGRPYLSKAHLVTRQVIPRGIYEQIKKQIIAIQKPAANKK